MDITYKQLKKSINSKISDYLDNDTIQGVWDELVFWNDGFTLTEHEKQIIFNLRKQNKKTKQEQNIKIIKMFVEFEEWRKENGINFIYGHFAEFLNCNYDTEEILSWWNKIVMIKECLDKNDENS